jgi:disulfide bond formation protein DsbB
VVDTQAFSRFFALLTLAANLLAAGILILFLLARVSERFSDAWEDTRDFLGEQALFLAWLIALTATLGSLYYSEVANFLPCKLCWYQRIAMYPMSIVLGIAAWRRDLSVRVYVLPLVAVGGAISIWHTLIERFPDLAGSASCDPIAPCTVRWVWELGFISIPFMALGGFAAIAALLLAARPAQPGEGGTDEHDIESRSRREPVGAAT